MVSTTIQITTKDADFIANIARKELESILEVQKQVTEEIAELEAEANKILEKHPEWEEAPKLLQKAKEESTAANTKFLKEETAKWQKVIELMMVGSKDDNNIA